MAPTKENELKSLQGKRQSLFLRIQRLYNDSRNLDDETVCKNFKIRYNTLEETRRLFSNCIDSINLLSLELDSDYTPSFAELEAVDELYCHIVEAAKKVFTKTESLPKPVKAIAKLPKIELMEFSGEMSDWPIFYDTFRTLIHENPDLDDITRMHYLLGKLTGKALLVCSGIQPTGANYPILWKALVEKYDDKRLLASTYLSQILDFRPLQNESVVCLNTFLEKFDTAVNALKQLDIENLSDFIISSIALSKLDGQTRRHFELSQKKSEIPLYKEIVDFVKDHTKILACTLKSTATTANRTNYSAPFSKPSRTHSLVVSNRASNNICPICNEASHLVYQCAKLLKLGPLERYQLVKDKALCLNCLSPKHKIIACKSTTTCSLCRKRHHSLLHFDKPHIETSEQPAKKDLVSISDVNSTSREPHSFCVASNTSFKSSRYSNTLLATAIVEIFAPNSKRKLVRLLVDPASQSHFITTNCCTRLNLPIRKINASVKGIGAITHPIKGKIDTVIASRFNSDYRYKFEALVIDQIIDNLPDRNIPQSSIENLLNLPLADEKFFESGEIDGIISGKLFPQILGPNKVESSLGSPIALETTLGYIVMGEIPHVAANCETHSFCLIEEPPLDKALEKFWSMEEVPSPSVSLNKDDAKCEELFVSTVKREPSGKYIVSLPFKEFPPNLGSSFQNAFRRYLALERKFRSMPAFHQSYCDAIQDFIEQGHMSLVEPHRLNSESSFYIPHHAIFKESTSTPLRVVFDASAKGSNSLSLNDVLYTGEKLQTDIVSLLLNFRLFAVAMTADVRQMYRQIWLNPDHRCFQRILWRFSINEPLQTYEINVVSFGVKASPFLALRTVKQLASDESRNFQLASGIVNRDTYMDDVVTSVPTSEEAIALYRDLIGLFRAGGFSLTKWTTNSNELLSEILESERCFQPVEFSNDSLKVLGFQWHPQTDLLGFKISVPDIECTKRNILSIIARIWDPLGLLAPVTLYAKLLIREIWVQKLGWDDPVSADIQKIWSLLKGELHLLENFEIPRHLGTCSNLPVTIVGFADASEKGYGAVVYVKVPEKVPTVRIICARSKVAPLKSLSIPRLELCAALLLARLIHFVESTFQSRLIIENIVALTDSSVVLNWINASPHRWHTFVANRVAKIQELVPSVNWYHVDGKENPADPISRGLTPAHLLNHPIWLTGPNWLFMDEQLWPINSSTNTDEPPLEEKPIVLVTFSRCVNPLRQLIDRSSSYSKLRNAVVYVLRFLKLLPKGNLITLKDLETAELTLVRLVQREHFASDLALLEQNKPCSPKIRSLCPFLKDGVIRVGGRLSNSNLEYDQQHPFLLPKKDHLVDLLIDYFHQRNLHTGPHLTLSLLRQKFWILAARNVVRHRIRNCNYCFKFRPRATFPCMADLPAPRITEAKPFLHSGVDYAGPFYITLTRRRGVKSQKAYLCLFICLVTKALHLEVASDLSTATFINAFKRFLSRRGPCSVLYSDCGTNFIGAKTALDDLSKFVTSQEYHSSIDDELIKRNVVWKFNPPAAPHFGGIWEANIKSVKSHLTKVIGTQILTYEEFTTVITQIEALLNSRPLCTLSSDPNEPLALTPAHFLTGTPLQSLPIQNLDMSTNLVTRKELLDQILQTYWKRWHMEYLHNLQVRQKWNKPSSPIKVGTVVVLRTDNTPPLHWPLGVVQEVFPGKDGIVRVASVKTPNGLYKRPIVRLCPLPNQ
ncbi:uncharacterized protein LOC103314804 [Tribolium castaneum]